MLAPNRTGKAAADSDQKCETDSPCIFVLLVVQGEGDLGGVLEVFNWSIIWEDSFLNEEDEVQEGAELDFLAVTGALGVLG